MDITKDFTFMGFNITANRWGDDIKLESITAEADIELGDYLLESTLERLKEAAAERLSTSTLMADKFDDEYEPRGSVSDE